MMKPLFALLIGILLSISTSCSDLKTASPAAAEFLKRTVVKTEGDLRAGMAALGGMEAKKLFGADLAKHDIQPVWVDIENNDNAPRWIFPICTDPDYYSPAEVAYIERSLFSPKRNAVLRGALEAMELPFFVPPAGRISGFIYANMDPGLKLVKLCLGNPGSVQVIRALVEVPGIKADYQDSRLGSLSSPHETIDCDEVRLQEELKKLPCCTTNSSGTRNGDPLNLVFIGDMKALLTALIGSGWSVTEGLSAGSVWRTIRSFLLRRYYRHAPVSPLHVFGRRQDAAFQKPRRTVDERNHLRVWLTPLRFEGKPVWVGQISRDIGVKLTLKTGFLVTHVIDPDVDNDRYYLVQDLIRTGALARLGYTRGVGESSEEEPRMNLGGDPYFTDGLRAVMRCSEETVPLSNLGLFDYVFPPDIEPYRNMLLKHPSLSSGM